MVLAAEVGGRWSQETVDFLNALAKVRAQESPQIFQGKQNRVGQTLERHFGLQLGQVVVGVLAGATASSRDRRRHPSEHEVVRDARFG